MLSPRSLVRSLMCGCAALLLVGSTVQAGAIRKLTLDPQAEVVELFAGIAQGQFETRVAPKNQFVADVFVTNTTDRPLTVAVPPTVAAVHELKQVLPGQGPFGDNGLGNNGVGNNAQAGAGQSVAGQLGAQGLPGGNNGFPGFPQNGGGNQFPGQNFFTVPPEQIVQLRLNSVCLDHGRPDPMPAMKYSLRQVDDVVTDPITRTLISQYDPRRTDRKALQAAVWHLRDDQDWNRLASKVTGIPVPVPYFSTAQLRSARQLVETARKATENVEPQTATTTVSTR